ncbi:hypothetical protein Poli38472_008708 [Pythium oligandrum]|uniref:BZIP domain-containing protein n=1 Tax=Pythium oligandrum TaxID=41045 RepID=A0A8K1C450_PYTOL|nr:hypothetical protein Poli38472_008708 [Pythium oligandrum]|eukprot:TMW56060.1 hypothetical protein Poli38472_008708 [Pythium oligandrum]
METPSATVSIDASDVTTTKNDLVGKLGWLDAMWGGVLISPEAIIVLMEPIDLDKPSSLEGKRDPSRTRYRTTKSLFPSTQAEQKRKRQARNRINVRRLYYRNKTRLIALRQEARGLEAVLRSLEASLPRRRRLEALAALLTETATLEREHGRLVSTLDQYRRFHAHLPVTVAQHTATPYAAPSEPANTRVDKCASESEIALGDYPWCG